MHVDTPFISMHSLPEFPDAEEILNGIAFSTAPLRIKPVLQPRKIGYNSKVVPALAFRHRSQ
jgi:hypothetical protein